MRKCYYVKCSKNNCYVVSSKRESDITCSPILIDGSPLHHVEMQKYLGTIFDKNYNGKFN